MRLRCLSISRTFTFTVLPTYSLRFSTYLVETCEAGMKARTPPSISAIKPPLTTSFTTVSKVLPSVSSAMRSSQNFLLWTFFLDRSTLPSPSFTLTTSTSISSPSFTSISASGSVENSARGM